MSEFDAASFVLPRRTAQRLTSLAGLATTLVVLLAATVTSAATSTTSLILEDCQPQGFPETVQCGQYPVFENRDTRRGRQLTLDVIVLPATDEKSRRPDPIVFLAGGPGQAATDVAPFAVNAPDRARRDIVFIDQRGTGGDHELRCDVPGGFDDPQGLLEPMFQVPVFERCRESLVARADLRRYGTATAADDLDEVLTALGYQQVNLSGASYGTRIALVFMRRHPERVRTATLNGVAPLSFLNPLYHAVSAQSALDGLYAACGADAACNAAFPRLEEELITVLGRLEAQPATVTLKHPEDGTPMTVRLARPAFAEALRFLMYNNDSIARVPALIRRARDGDFAPFALLAMQTNLGLRQQLDLGMLLSVVCAEDVARIDRATIDDTTGHSFLGAGRVRREMAVCDIWPEREVPAADVAPVVSDIPTLLLSGTLDPVTSPRWGDEAARHLRNSLHVVAPGGHGIGGPCIGAITASFLDRGAVKEIDTSCVAEMALPPFELPEAPIAPDGG